MFTFNSPNNKYNHLTSKNYCLYTSHGFIYTVNGLLGQKVHVFIKTALHFSGFGPHVICAMYWKGSLDFSF